MLKFIAKRAAFIERVLAIVGCILMVIGCHDTQIRASKKPPARVQGMTPAEEEDATDSQLFIYRLSQPNAGSRK